MLYSGNYGLVYQKSIFRLSQRSYSGHVHNEVGHAIALLLGVPACVVLVKHGIRTTPSVFPSWARRWCRQHPKSVNASH